MIVEDLVDFQPVSAFVRVRDFIRDDVRVYLKIEIFNPGGSIKFKPAVGIIRALEVCGELRRGCSIIDTTSGNMGIALSIVSRARGYGFVCVCDEKITLHNKSLIKAYGVELVVLPRSTLKERYSYIESRMKADPSLVWTRQFTNEMNPRTHETTTAQEVLAEFPELDYLFVGAGTAGTLTGCARALARYPKDVRLVAVDAEGSRHFRDFDPSHQRLLPGIGATERSPFLDKVKLHDAVVVPERETILASRELVQSSGWLLGASSGSVLAGIKRLQNDFRRGDVVVGIAADSGERYLDGLYDERWLESHFPDVGARQPGCELIAAT